MLFIILRFLEHLFNEKEDREEFIKYQKIDDKPNPKKRNRKKIQKRKEKRENKKVI